MELQIYLKVNGVAVFLHGAALSAIKIQGAGIQWGCNTGVYSTSDQHSNNDISN